MSDPIRFGNLSAERAIELDRLTRLVYETRENRKRLLAMYAVSDEAALLARIATGDLPEHPSYEHYLGAKVLEESRAAAREAIVELLDQVRRA